MERTHEAKLVFSKKHSRMAFINECFRWLMLQSLRKQTRSHISKKRKQLVVFSFDYIAHYININGVYEKDDLDIFLNGPSQSE